MSRRLIRRKPLGDRIKDWLHPGDFLLWLSEEIETRDWDSKHVASPVALGLHVALLIARANSGSSGNKGSDDVFGDDNSGSGWLSYISTFVLYILTGFSVLNAFYTFLRVRHYRLFERPIDAPQTTPSQRRVRIDSSPVSSSPLRFLTNIIGAETAESRAHPDASRDVWEMAVWDPLPVCLSLFCLFSPGHVLVYWLFLPTLSSDPRPSITVVTALFLQILMSSQLTILRMYFSQQEKDSAIIQQEVISEYDIKFVHPRLNPLVRDVGTQFYGPNSNEGEDGDVDAYTPAITLKRGFRTNPNPNYAKHVDPDNTESFNRSGRSQSPFYTPSAYNSRNHSALASMTPKQPLRQPQFRQSMADSASTGVSTGDGGSLGVFSHARSPLKKATSMYDMQAREAPRNSAEMAAREQGERSRSPTKRRLSEAHRSFLGLDDNRRTSSPANLNKPKPGPAQYSRMPSRF
ncbi:hypothetical protein GLAREA_01996 [Glarea lozoyensis ATCC 20868]|uniref:Meiotically up-regulated gene 154 protein n=1 Tax=Glarea lozoyensis (strain ATCC 20868 / MF5171) TaxID=1116229 RepID=S3CLJ7_GLAL2|nr:uncharacterized protein GLAREA_01996 [Glarea lozoyensis ATCC 20868]EPE26084.1 hypothetical protein GLAREA_01996 [Glarea lozoyensis ATCC 20868]